VLHSLHPDRFSPRDSYDSTLYYTIVDDPAYELNGKWEFVNYWLWVYTRVPPE